MCNTSDKWSFFDDNCAKFSSFGQVPISVYHKHSALKFDFLSSL